MTPLYRLFLVMALLVAAVWTIRRASGRGLAGEWVMAALLVGVLGGLMGGKAFYLLAQPGSRAPWHDFLDMAEGGFSIIGGFLGASAAAWAYLRLAGRTAGDLADSSAPAAGLFLCLARVSCFIKGCDFGKESPLPWAVSFPAGSPPFDQQLADGLIPPGAACSLPVHPLQLYESALGLLMIGVALTVDRRRRFSGQAATACAFVYCAGRFLLDFLRDPQSTPRWHSLLPAQILALGGAAFTAALLLRRRRRS